MRCVNARCKGAQNTAVGVYGNALDGTGADHALSVIVCGEGVGVLIKDVNCIGAEIELAGIGSRDREVVSAALNGGAHAGNTRQGRLLGRSANLIGDQLGVSQCPQYTPLAVPNDTVCAGQLVSDVFAGGNPIFVAFVNTDFLIVSGSVSGERYRNVSAGQIVNRVRAVAGGVVLPVGYSATPIKPEEEVAHTT